MDAPAHTPFAQTATTRNRDHRVTFVTGAGAGIGRASALAFAARGDAVAVADIDVEAAAETVRQIELAGGIGRPLRCDVSVEADVRAAVEATVDSFGGLDYALNNAGFGGPPRKLVDWRREDFDRILAVNVTGTWLCLKHELRYMQEQGGVIVNMASMFGMVGFADLVPYTATKHAVIGLTRGAALEHAAAGVRVNAIAPGTIDTPSARAFGNTPEEREAADAVQLANLPIGRMGRPDEVADVATWLCSDASSFVTGSVITVDGGWTSR
ncbi:SDR family NAD(P)-dependent oxidoreductase [Microbacterium sp. SORGH_AS_0888]|uniref:SDR family NAD(P)-dependent oxidoreductase n=1 Tax=Microbacterium sp. SORGH_AS_0888 TaxID=3041791 RepID=UPI00277E1E3D|nr:glucose 1-dehydrogenase [Microbacterium sp. SORGH_AS_0888]MDQ1131009.1 NAD(P)-dependent dehydrogenase (short-subunit alcohol dehydrogenase family) [Microbacterium sp. SORGH_AS_0888]